MSTDGFDAVVAELRDAQRFVLCTHEHPDGDALGSLGAMQHALTALGKDAVVHQYVDEAIIGGLVIRVGDKLIDASVRNQLSAMRQQLLAAAPK